MVVRDIIKETINDVANEMQLLIEIMENDNSFTIFVKNDWGGYCPYIFNLMYETEGENSVSLYFYWSVRRMFAPGEKTDLYVLFANSMNIILKVVFNDFARVEYQEHVVCPNELGGANLFLCEKVQDINIQELSERVSIFYEKFIIAMQMHYILFGTYGVELKRNIDPKQEWVFEGIKVDNVIVREDHVYLNNWENQISLLELSEQQYNFDKIIESHKWEILEAIDGKIIVQNEMTGKSYNILSNNCWDYVEKIIQENKCKKYTIICQENILYVLCLNKIWIIPGEYYHYWVENETKKLIERQKRENEVLFFNKNFKWKFPIKPSRFEELIGDLLEMEPKVSRVRLVGKTNNPDGGRDVLIFKMKYDNTKEVSKEYLVIGQCKAYMNSVNKSHVLDIRDMLDNYNAKGFVLAVASNLTVPLLDYLMKLEENYEIEWWTEREIFAKLRRNYYLVERYKDIVEVV